MYFVFSECGYKIGLRHSRNAFVGNPLRDSAFNTRIGTKSKYK
jgi:hypothetical protein